MWIIAMGRNETVIVRGSCCIEGRSAEVFIYRDIFIHAGRWRYD
jgi:hypothetical protein